ncbi:unnamed protein product [Spirodela intermedia]|uniref:Uncharacterized protein n=1 Tax=Spirodela intermedia TaxID=51605 RepID=A0A7I8J1J4_SPIIN|nr:unnamed protein product [Spirodela intermedia]CAA6664085.1 unnamed protein product [Spirodela intermedia]
MKNPAFFCISLVPATAGVYPRRILASLCRALFFTFSSSWAARSRWSPISVVITNPVLSVLETCGSMRDLKQVQGHMVRTGMIDHRFPASRLLAFCALSEAGDLEHARRIFSKISEPNAYMWNAMIRGYHWWRSSSAALHLFRCMVREDAEMDGRTFVFVLKVCESSPQVAEGECIHSRLHKLGFELDLLVRNALMHFYVRYGFVASALDLFDRSSERDVVSWTTMIDGHAQVGSPGEALKLVRAMMLEGRAQPNEVTMITVLSSCSQLGLLNLGRSIHAFAVRYSMNMTTNLLNALIDMYGKCGCVDSARQVFAGMRAKDVFSWTSIVNGYAKSGNLKLARQLFEEMPERNSISWSAMIAGYSQASLPEPALELFQEMQSTGVDPIEATLLSVLSACAQSGRLDIGQRVRHYLTSRKIKLTTALGNAFIDISKLFAEMPERDLVSWNSMILAHAVHGNSEEALTIFEKMKIADTAPDSITFVGVLSACGHGGLVAEGKKQFREMIDEFSLQPMSEHYACMVDLLSMPAAPDRAAWGALLHACRIYGEVELGKLVAEKLMVLDPSDSGIYMLLSNLCAVRGEWEGVKMARRRMREGGIRKAPGRSSIEVDGELHEFFASGRSHPLSAEIYRILDLVYAELCWEGHEADR